VLVLGPHRGALSGISSHLNSLFASPLAAEFALVHFQVGSQGRAEGRAGRWLRLLISPFALAIAIVAHRVTVVHLNTALNVRAYWRDLAYLVVAKICGRRVLYQVHGGALPHEFFPWSRALTAVLRAALRLADAIVVLARVELEAYRRFVPGREIVAVPNAIDCAPYATVARPRSDAQSPLRLAYIGRLAREKGLYELLLGLHSARRLRTQLQLTIAGSGPEESRLKRFAAALGLARNVEFVGPIFGEDKIKLLANADAFILASYSEGLPYAMLESMAAGVPVVATPVGAIPDVVVEGVHGLFVPPGDAVAIAEAIARLALDRDLLARMSAACRTRIAGTYSIAQLTQAFARVYSDLSGARQRMSPRPET